MRHLLLLLLLATPAFALPLRDGTIEFDSIIAGDGPVHLRGKHFVFDGVALFARLDANDCSFPCAPGETVNLYMRVTGNDLPGIATFEDVRYTDVGSLEGPNQMGIEIKGRTRLPRIRDKEQVSKTELVRIRVTFIHEQVPLLQPVVETFMGDAIATLTLQLFVDPYDGEKLWYITHLAYDVVR